MVRLESLFFILALVTTGLYIVFVLAMFIVRKLRPEPAKDQPASVAQRSQRIYGVGVGLVILGLIFLTLTIILRTFATGHGPFSNMYEFAVAFAWGVMAAGLFFQYRYKMPSVTSISSLVAFGMLLFANALPSKPVPLVPALQQSFLLSAHVTAAVIAYGCFTMGFSASVVYLVRSRHAASGANYLAVLDDMSYLAVKIGFPFMTVLIVLGALWADIAWGSYWSWDPKETASLVTWLLFASYLHARLMRGWRGRKTALLLIIGFAAVLFTFLGNYIFVGLHSYG
jgi:cytochrome c-type biogenesis protein CcsB